MNRAVSDTPRTDAKEKETVRLGHYKHAYYGWKFARVLERELNEAMDRLGQLQPRGLDEISR